MEINEPFWFVWNPSGTEPRYRHASTRAALAEAERLVRLNRGELFVLLQEKVMRITRKFWIDSHGNKWIVFCAGGQLVWMSQYDEAFEVMAA